MRRAKQGSRRSRRRAEHALRKFFLRRAPTIFLRLFQPRSAELGELGEGLAARYLRSQGWRLVGRRVRSPYGEIDLVARCDGVCACVEVKTGREVGPLGDGDCPPPRWRPGDRLTARTLARQRRAARWLAFASERARVDLIEILIRPEAPRVQILHHTGLTRPLRGGAKRGTAAPQGGFGVDRLS